MRGSVFLTGVLAILVVAHGRPRGVCTCQAMSVIVNTILLLLFFYRKRPLPIPLAPTTVMCVLDVRV